MIPELYEEHIRTRLKQLHTEAECQRRSRHPEQRTPWRHAIAVALLRLAELIEPGQVSATRTT